MSAISRQLGLNIRAARVRRDWTQTQLGEAIGLSVSAVSELERGRRSVSLEEAMRICRALDVTLARLCEGMDPEDVAGLGL